MDLQTAVQPAAAPSGFDFLKERAGIREFRMRSNRLRILLAQNRVAPVATFCIVYHVGSRDEAVGHTGATHLLEHLLFKGTAEFNRERGTQIAAVLESVGARFNATTWFDRTNYYETVPSDGLPLAMAIEASRMRGSWIADSDRRTEMTVVRNEFERGENSPFQVLYKLTFATAFREHPYHHPTIGWRSDIEGVSTERLKKFYDTFYYPDNATALLIGDFEEEAALSLIDRHFGPLPASPEPIPRVYTVEPPQQGERRFLVRRTGSIGWVGLSWRAPAARDPANFPLTVLANVLGAGMTARLYRLLVEANLALSVQAVPWQLRDPSLFSVFAALTPGVEHRRVERLIREEVDRIRQSGITAPELARAQAQIEADVIFDRDSTDQVAAALSEAIAMADWEWYIDYPDRIRQVTLEEVRETARRAFDDDSITVGWFVPKEPASPGGSR